MPSCGGCGTCELACSYHHSGKFGPSASSLIIKEKEDSRGYIIEFLEKKTDDRFACDGCKGIEEPLCLEWCKKKDDLKKYLSDFLKKIKQ